METLSAILSNTLLVTLTKNSLSERLEIATLNTLLGVITVFSVLILLILLIYMFKIFPYIEGKKKDKKKNVSNSTEPVITSSDIVLDSAESESINLTDNLELIAVITAAISASMGEAIPADGLVVRSIRKVNKRR